MYMEILFYIIGALLIYAVWVCIKYKVFFKRAFFEPETLCERFVCISICAYPGLLLILAFFKGASYGEDLDNLI